MGYSYFLNTQSLVTQCNESQFSNWTMRHGVTEAVASRFDCTLFVQHCAHCSNIANQGLVSDKLCPTLSTQSVEDSKQAVFYAELLQL